MPVGVTVERTRLAVREVIGRPGPYRAPRIAPRLPEVVLLADARPLPEADGAASQRARLELLRDRAILRVLYATGMRRAEVASLTRADVADGFAQEEIITGKGQRERTVFFDDATLAVIGRGATVGPFAYLRPGATLDPQSKVGTFVEIKNSTIGERSKVPHLSYIGDTTIGRGVNLGAGAITANYDDLAKHRTEIGDEVHSGSHNVFVAPVRIGDGAKNGAGAVIRKDVPPGALALSVAPQRNIEGWVENNRPGTAAAEVAARARSAQEADDGEQEQDG